MCVCVCAHVRVCVFCKALLVSIPIAVTRFCSPGSSCSLIGRCLRRPAHLKCGHSSHLIIVPPLDHPCIDHVLDSRDREGGLGYIGCHDTHPDPLRGSLEYLSEKVIQLSALCQMNVYKNVE